MKVIRTTQLTLLAFIAMGAWACNSTGTDAGASSSSGAGGSGDEDERGSLGPAHPSYEYCTNRGGKIQYAKDASADGLCIFPDGTSCPVYRFWNAECGQAHSYCEEHGGKIARKERDMGGWTAIVAVCTLNGKECDEHEFMKSGKCP